jgi:hypothetical protein
MSARKAGPGRPKGDRNDVSVKIDKRIVGMARYVALHQGKSIAELLSGILEGPIEREYVKLVAMADKEVKEEGVESKGKRKGE